MTAPCTTTNLIPRAKRHDPVIKGNKALKRTAGVGGRGGRHPSTPPPRGKTMLQQSNGTASKHSLNGHVPINGKDHGSKMGAPLAFPEAGSARTLGLGGITPEAVRHPSRKPVAKGTTKAKARKVVQRFGRPYALPLLLACHAEKSAANLEIYCRLAIGAAWKAGEHGRVKAAREEIASWRFTPADIAAVARLLADYNYTRAWPQGAEKAQKIEWLSIGHGCVEKFGTAYDAHLAAWSALSAALSIIVDVPLEREEDAEALLATLTYTGWRHVPLHQQSYVALRMARFVSDRIMGLPFVPTAGRGL
jgi:hypothetical protein